MSIYEDVKLTTRQVIADHPGAQILSPTFIARAVMQEFGNVAEEHNHWASLEGYKAVARRELAGKYSTESDENPAHQGDLFSGLLQDRYPIPHAPGTDPAYKLRDSMDAAELDWNIAHLEASADARLQHADALRAFRDGKFGPKTGTA